MRKEVAFAIFAGIGAGLVLAFGVWKISSKVSDAVVSPTPSQTESANSAASPAAVAVKGLNILSPQALSIHSDSDVTINGQSLMGHIVVVGQSEDSFAATEESGSFTIPTSLNSGLNRLNIYSFDAQGALKNVALDLIYSSEFAEVIAQNQGKTAVSYSGSITDINENNIQVKSDNGTILQITTAEDASFVKAERPENTYDDIKLSDIAIGDYIVAMGFTASANQVLDAKRIMVDQQPENKNVAIYGNIATLSKKEITITKPEGEDVSITLPKSWEGPDTTDMEEGQNIIVVGSQDDEDFSLRTIFDLQQ